MPRVFVDTTHLVAVLIHDDNLHESAVHVATRLEREHAAFYTTQFVIAELLAAMSRRGAYSRQRAVEYLEFLASQPTWTIEAVSNRDFDAAMALYKSRSDQRYSLTDCISMILCKKLGITDVLTSDSDFAHEGFTILLKT